MCGDGCVRNIRRVVLAVPAGEDKKESRFFGACLTKTPDQKTMIAIDGCGAAMELDGYLKKTGAQIIDR